MGRLNEIRRAFDDFVAPPVDLLSNRPILPGKDPGLFYVDRRTLDAIPLAPEPHVLYSKMINSIGEENITVGNVFALFRISEDSAYMDLIYHLKYYGFYKLGTELGALLAKRLDKDYEAMVPVPLHHARHRERGYNQSLAIAEGISNANGTPINEKLIRRVRYTLSQTVLPTEQRNKNVSDVFEPYDEQRIEGNYLVVDDVFTTGSTANRIANILLNKGARSVDVATLATG